MSKTGRALIRSAVGQSTAMAVTLITGMILLPVILHHLGDRLYGAWVLVSMLLGYYGLLDFGLSYAVSRFVSQALGRDDKDEADGIVTTSFYLYSLAGTISFIITIAVAVLSRHFVDNPEEVVLFRNVFLVTGFSLGISLPARCYLGILNAHLRYDISSIVDICSALLRTILFVGILSYGGKLFALALAAAAINLVNGGATIILAQWVHGRTKLNLSSVTHKRVVKLLKYGFYAFIAQISDLLRLNAYPFIISSFLGLQAVTPYGIAENLKNIIVRFTASILSTLAPVFSRHESRKDQDALRWTYFFTYKVSCYVGVFSVGMMAILGANFVLRWVGDNYAIVIPILYVLIGGCFWGIIQIPTVTFLYGTSGNKFYAISNTIEGLTNIILSIILVRPYGLMGMAWSMVIATALTKTLIQPVWICRALKISLLRYHFWHTLPNVSKPIIFICVVFVATRPFLTPNYFCLAVVGVGAFLFYLPYIMLIGFNAQERYLFSAAIMGSKAIQQGPKSEQEQA